MKEIIKTDFAQSFYKEDDEIIIEVLENLVLSHAKGLGKKTQELELFVRPASPVFLRARAKRRAEIDELLEGSDLFLEWKENEEPWEKFIAYRKEKKVSYKRAEGELRAFILGMNLAKAAGQPLAMLVWQSISRGWQGLFPVRDLNYQRLFFETYGKERQMEEILFNPLPEIESYEPVGKLFFDYELQSPQLKTNLPPSERGAFASGLYSHHLLEMAMVYGKTALKSRLIFSREEWDNYLKRKYEFSSLPGDNSNYAALPMRIAAKQRLVERARPDSPKLTLLNYSLTIYR